MVRLPIYIFFIILLLNAAFVNSTDDEEDEDRSEMVDNIQRKKKEYRSTSSDSGEAKGADSGKADDESLDISDLSSTKEDKVKTYTPPSSKERPGWRKWHRKCQQCPEDMKKKWRDPSVKWICGVYQRARRSFKSVCMMQYRNCQDGTMFVKLHDHRCKNDTSREYPHGEHFFYEYDVRLSGDSSNSKSSSTQEESHGSSSSSSD